MGGKSRDGLAMDQDTLDLLNEVAAAYNNLVCRDKETPVLAEALDRLEQIALNLIKSLENTNG